MGTLVVSQIELVAVFQFPIYVAILSIKSKRCIQNVRHFLAQLFCEFGVGFSFELMEIKEIFFQLVNFLIQLKNFFRNLFVLMIVILHLTINLSFLSFSSFGITYLPSQLIMLFFQVNLLFHQLIFFILFLVNLELHCVLFFFDNGFDPLRSSRNVISEWFELLIHE